YSVKLDEVRPAADGDRALYQAHILGAQADALRSAGKLDDAMSKAAQALTLAVQGAGPQDAYVADLGGALGELQRSKGLSQEAEQTFLHAIDVSTAAVGHDDPHPAMLMVRLGTLYEAENDYAKAEPLLEDAVSIVDRTLGDHPDLIAALRALSLVHQDRGDYERTRSELERALGIADRTLTPDDFNGIAIVHNLGDLYVRLGNLDRAKSLSERALKAIERTLGPNDLHVTNPLLNLSIIAREQGDYPRALAYLERAYDVRKKIYGEEHTQTASILISLGNIYKEEGQFQTAIDTYQRAYDVLERTAGPYHEYTLMAMGNMASAYAAEGKLDEAVQYQARYDALVEKRITFNLAIGSEREKLAYEQTTFEKMGRTISLNLEQAPDNAAAADLALSAILRRKGRVLDALADNLHTLRARLAPDDQRLLDDYGSVTASLSKLALNGPGKVPGAEYRKQLASLDTRRDVLEAQISSRSAEFRADTQEPSLAAVRAALPEGSALVEYVVYQPFNPKAKNDKDEHGAPRYAAYVVGRGGKTRGADLGPVQGIDDQVRRVRDALRDPSRSDVIALARALDARVFSPVRALMGGATQLLIAPDGELNLVPFQALVDDRGRFEIQRYAMSYLSSGRDVLRMEIPHASAGRPLVVADPAFGDRDDAGVSGANVQEASTGVLSTTYFSPLDGTAQEATVIGHLLPNAIVLTGPSATKDALLHASAPSILHIASHAFFLGDKPAAASGPTRGASGDATLPNPLLQSGIALAGANLPSRGQAAILTALEVSTLNLWGTKLVTLSACDTGVGDVKDGEGVYGLRRAFFVAGAQSVVMSLWPVSDYVTRTMMTRYYAGLTHGEGRAAALRRVQLAMLSDKNWHHPFYWAGFIEAGDWTPIHHP
ncbi:MAG: CHAT domain-containing protein, partial [Vicinamibacterales bacterium]